MNAESISIAIGSIDDDLIEAVDALRGNSAAALRGNSATALWSKRKPDIRWKRWTALAACLCLVVGIAAIFFQGFPILGAKCGGNPGVLINGSYYYATDFAFYRYIPDQIRERLISSFFVSKRGGLRVDNYGLYYVKGRSLYVRVHETGASHKLYTADKEIWIRYIENGKLTFWLYDKRKLSDEFQPYVCVDVINGEIIWERAIAENEEYAILDSGNANREYPVGSHIYRIIEIENPVTKMYHQELHLDGQPFIVPSENEYIEFWLEYYDSNLLIQYRAYSREPGDNYDEALGDYMYILASPGTTTELPSERYIAGTDDYLFYLVADAPEAVTGPFPESLFSYNVTTGETRLLMAGMDIYTAVTDGTWFFTNVPWSGRTDCWKLVYDGSGNLIGLELWAGDI